MAILLKNGYRPNVEDIHYAILISEIELFRTMLSLLMKAVVVFSTFEANIAQAEPVIKVSFQSTLPTQGATLNKTYIIIDYTKISIHAPYTGSDRHWQRC